MRTLCKTSSSFNHRLSLEICKYLKHCLIVSPFSLKYFTNANNLIIYVEIHPDDPQ